MDDRPTISFIVYITHTDLADIKIMIKLHFTKIYSPKTANVW